VKTVNNSILDFLWSLWAELGVSGWARHHQEWWIDPEALLLFTATCADLDARLSEEAAKWAICHSHLLSAGRFKNLLRQSKSLEAALKQTQAARFLGSIRAHTQLRLPGEKEGKVLALRRAGVPLDLSHPAQLSLRLRGLFGVGARAEVLRIFLLGELPGYSASHLVEEGVGFNKRTVQIILDDLVLTKVLSTKRRGPTVIFRLTNREPLKELAAVHPLISPRWLPLFEVLHGFRSLRLSKPGTKVSTLALTARTAAKRLDDAVSQADLPAIPHHIRGNAFLPEFEKWSQGILDQLVAGRLPGPELSLRWG
jgi:hypothetical protein